VKLAVYDDYRVGVVEAGSVFDVTAAVPGASAQWPPVFMNTLIADWSEAQARIVAAQRAARPVPLTSVSLLAPNPCPIHVIAAPANYRKHIAEMGALSVTPKGRTAREQGFFLKASASITGAGRGIEIPKGSHRRYDHESELAVVIGRETRNVTRAEALAAVFGYSCLVDVTMRIEPDGRAEERVMRKSLETFTPLGPWIVTADELGDPSHLRNQLFVNGECRQDAVTSDLIVDIPDLISFISSVVTLHPGDVIATGTPSGIGPIVAGDEVTIRIERVGEMRLKVRETAVEPAAPFWEPVSVQ
jgi:2-keto-4-pentenoate hydratase/2-oxohepta-3-ene-1,7-dioic acid hydratase in catechol pathway